MSAILNYKVAAIHNARYRKTAYFDNLRSQNPITDFDETWHG